MGRRRGKQECMAGLGDTVRTARVEAGLTLRELARRLDRAPSYINDIENDRRVPSEEVLSDIARTLPLDLDRLLSLAGRVGSDAESYVRNNPSAGVLLRKVSGANLGDAELQQLIRQTQQLIDRRDEKP